VNTFAVTLLSFFLVGYFVLAGADIGVGMLLPFLGRDRRLTLAAIAPFFLGNEVWLVSFAGLLSALYPGLEADVFGRVWGPLIVLVLAWIIRDTGLWLRGRREGGTWRTSWDVAIVTGSWGVAASWGGAIGALMGGVPLFAVTTCGLFALHGAIFAAVRLGTDAPRAVARRVVPAALVAGVPCAVGAGAGDLARTVPAAALLAVTLAGGWAALTHPSARNAARWALAASALAITVVPLFGALALPDADLAHGATFTLAVVGPMVPLLIAVQAWVWWTFRGRIDAPSYL
jgi:cytochrome bd ubiquinol oxidase subunit II